MKWVIVDTQNYGNRDINWYYKGKVTSKFLGMPIPEYTKDIKNAKIFNNKRTAYGVGAKGKIRPLKECLK